jgi:hypothetical protein
MATATRKPKRRAKPKRAARSTPRAPDAPLTESPIGDKLTDEMKLAVVQRLAMYDTPQQVADAVKEEYGIEITRQAIHYYDPTHEPKPPEKWCKIFDSTRAEFLKTTANIPIANRSFRLHRLERMAVAAEKQRNFALAAQLYEQAAKEVGELFTNKRNIGLSGEVKGGVLAVPVPISAEEWGKLASTQQSDLQVRARTAAAAATAQVTSSSNGTHA